MVSGKKIFTWFLYIILCKNVTLGWPIFGLRNIICTNSIEVFDFLFIESLENKLDSTKDFEFVINILQLFSTG